MPLIAKSIHRVEGSKRPGRGGREKKDEGGGGGGGVWEERGVFSGYINAPREERELSRGQEVSGKREDEAEMRGNLNI